MNLTRQNANHAARLSVRVGGAIGTFLVFGALFAAAASANFEQVASFANSGGVNELENVTDIAVNTTGSGGVPAGTVYIGALSYSASGELIGPWAKARGNAIAIDRSSGDIYALSNRAFAGEQDIEVSSADGSKLLTSFGEVGAFGETFDEGPEKIHGVKPGGIAVDGASNVYIADLKASTPESPSFGTRVMAFRPESPGDHEHYVYAGRSHDIVAPHGGIAMVAVDDAGDIYTASEEAIYEFAPGEPATVICEYQEPSGGIDAMTVNQTSGEVFFFSGKNEKIHQLGACGPQGEFEETGEIIVVPKPNQGAQIEGLAFNPILAYGASRPPGVLYAVDPKAITGGGRIFAPAEAHLPAVESESVSSVTSTTATLGAQINPKGSPTHYAFQYITAAAYEANEPAERFAGASEAPLGGGLLAGSQVALGTAATLAGLPPETEYHYRVVATNDDGSTSGPDQTFATFPVITSGLPDNRVYELVSPAQKNGGEVFPSAPFLGSCNECKPGGGEQTFPMQSSPNGEAVVYEGFPFSLTEGAAINNEYLSKRTASGWQTTILAPALMGGGLAGYRGFNADLTDGVLYQQDPSLTPESPSEYSNLYTQPSSAPTALTPLVGSEPPDRSTGSGGAGFKLAYAGASADFSRLFFAANDALTAETPFAPEALDGGALESNLYESNKGELSLINVLPGNAETAPGAAIGAAPENVGNFEDLSDLSHAISGDGSRVFWSDHAGQAYVRKNGEVTEKIPDPSKFLTASADGSKVLLSDGKLFNVDDLEQTPVDLTEGKGGFKGIAGQSEDLSHVYFVDSAALTGDEQNDHGSEAQEGQDNLYDWHEGTVAFLATLAAGDQQFGFGAGDWAPAPAQRAAEASPDGRWVTFLSQAPLTGYDNAGPCGNGGQSGACAEVFLYDSVAGKLSCISCNSSNQRPLGRSVLPLITPTADAEDPLPQMRYLTDAGRLYFDSSDSLTPFDTNKGVEDVYQYEPNGIGTCTREGGCVGLLSAGNEPVDSDFLAISETGRDVFFTTRDQLVAKDRDDLVDLYDAREGGGIAAESEGTRSECDGEACKGPIASPPPVFGALGSAAFSGPGNLTPPTPATPKPKPLTSAQKLTKALKACRSKHDRHKRSACEAQAHKRYGPKSKSKSHKGSK